MPLPVLQLVFFGTFQILRVELLNATRQFEVVKEQKQDYILYSEKEHKEFVTDWDRYVISNIVRNPMATSADLKSSIWINKQKCMNYGIEFSRVNNCKILLSKVIKSISWH